MHSDSSHVVLLSVVCSVSATGHDSHRDNRAEMQRTITDVSLALGSACASKARGGQVRPVLSWLQQAWGADDRLPYSRACFGLAHHALPDGSGCGRSRQTGPL